MLLISSEPALKLCPAWY